MTNFILGQFKNVPLNICHITKESYIHLKSYSHNAIVTLLNKRTAKMVRLTLIMAYGHTKRNEIYRASLKNKF